MNKFRVYGSFAFCLLWVFMTSPTAFASPYVPGPQFSPIPGPGIPGPKKVSGKEYSNHFDMEGHPGLSPDPEQNIAWDGMGGTRNAYDYSGSRSNLGDDQDRDVDALANRSDALFTAVIANAAALLFSTDNDSNIYVESIGGIGSIWAAPPQINDEIWVPPGDVDGLEVWGADSEAGDDANIYSLEGDSVTDNTNNKRISIFSYNAGSNTSSVTFYTEDIARALGNINLLTDLIDVDAMLYLNGQIIFSLDPIAGIYDGGEIWVWDGLTTGGATFLNHGGHLWDTAFDVQGTFGTASENINALEAVGAVPEPASMLLFGVGLVGLVGYGRRKSQKKN